MSYVEKNLLPQEEIGYRAHLHWLVYFPAILLFVIGVGALALTAVVEPSAVAAVRWAGMGLVVLGIVMFLARWVVVKTSEFAVTNKRVLVKVGLVRRHSLELLLGKVEGIGVDQSIAGRIFGYGTITISGTGGTREPFSGIARPLEFRRQVQSRIPT